MFGGTDAWDMQQLIAETRRAALIRNVLLSNAESGRCSKVTGGYGRGTC